MKLCTLELAYLNIFYTGKNKPSVKRCCFSACFKLWFIMAFILNLHNIYYEIITPTVTITVSFLFVVSFVLRIITYFLLWLRRKQLMQLCMVMKKINGEVTSKAYFILNILHILNVAIFLFFPALFFYIACAINNVFRSKFPESFEKLLHSYINEYAYVFNEITLPIFVTIIHGSVCLWCSIILKNTKKK